MPFFVPRDAEPHRTGRHLPLPEAQLDRFLFKISVGYSKLDELATILDRTTGSSTPEDAESSSTVRASSRPSNSSSEAIVART